MEVRRTRRHTGISLLHTTVSKYQSDFALVCLLHSFQPLPTLDHVWRDDLDQRLEELIASAPLKPFIPGIKSIQHALIVRFIFLLQFTVTIEPAEVVVGVCLVAFGGSDSSTRSQGRDDFRIDLLHAFDRIRCECDSGTDLTEAFCLFVYLHFDVLAEKTDGEDKTDYSTADDGHRDGFIPF